MSRRRPETYRTIIASRRPNRAVATGCKAADRAGVSLQLCLTGCLAAAAEMIPLEGAQVLLAGCRTLSQQKIPDTGDVAAVPIVQGEIHFGGVQVAAAFDLTCSSEPALGFLGTESPPNDGRADRQTNRGDKKHQTDRDGPRSVPSDPSS